MTFPSTFPPRQCQSCCLRLCRWGCGRRRSRSAKPIVHISTGILLRRPDAACDSPGSGIAISSSVYEIPCSYMRGRAVVTNTAPTSAYRSAGRPEVVFVLERMIDIACRRHGFDRLEVRRRNLVPPKAMPYRNPLGLVYDSGDYPASLRQAAELGDWTGFAVRRAEARRRGRCRGIGVAMSIELNTGAPRERAELTIDPSGTVELVLGTMSAGQGHETSFAQVIAEWLGAEPERVRLVTGDTDRVQASGNSTSAQSMRLDSW